MKTKREVLKNIANGLLCKNLQCENCPYNNICYSKENTTLSSVLTKIGAMAILRQNRKKRVFDKSKILTCVTADQAKLGMRGYFADDLKTLEKKFRSNVIYTLEDIYDTDCGDRFYTSIGRAYPLFYPIEEVEE